MNLQQQQQGEPAVWWSQCGKTGYLGTAMHDGLEWSRHSALCEPGKWFVCVTGWPISANAVADDFGNLVRVQ